MEVWLEIGPYELNLLMASGYIKYDFCKVTQTICHCYYNEYCAHCDSSLPRDFVILLAVGLGVTHCLSQCC